MQAGTIAENIKSIDNQVNEVLDAVDITLASAIASVQVGAIADKEIRVLKTAKLPKGRQVILKELQVTNHRKNYERYLLPLVMVNWLTMTVPDKPTSPKQKYLTTLKGRLVLEILKKSGIGNLESGKNKKQ